MPHALVDNLYELRHHDRTSLASTLSKRGVEGDLECEVRLINVIITLHKVTFACRLSGVGLLMCNENLIYDTSGSTLGATDSSMGR